MMLLRRADSSGVVYYFSPRLAEIDVPHAFSTRIGGISDGAFTSLNLGNPTGIEHPDSSDNIAENYRRLQRAIDCADRQRCYVHQVHGDAVLTAARGEEFANGRCADAIITDDPARLATIRTADCVPILLATSAGKKVAAVHSGWRGVIAGIVPTTIQKMGEVQSIRAAIGPCIGFSAFEVGEEVLNEFTRVFGSCAPIQRTCNGKGFVDLREAVRLQLLSAGMSDDHIDTTDRCTVRDEDEFFSHRRDRGITGRLAALIGASDPSLK